MSDKKVITISVILAVILIAAGWAYSRKSPGPAAISTPPINAPRVLVMGNENAPVTIEEYTNFLCPACGKFAKETLPQLENDYVKTGKVKIIFYIFPPFELSRAAFCSAEQDKFAIFHDYLFAHSGEISKEQDVLDFAVKVGMDQLQFNACYNSDAAKKAAQAWLDEGQKRGVDATPTFFINGEKVVGSKPYSEFQKMIDGQLNK